MLPAGEASAPVLWWLSLDDPAARARAEGIAPLPGGATAFARRADAGERLLRRRLARLLVAELAGCRADRVTIGRTAAGAPHVETPAGWFVSVAGRWPACLIGAARRPLGVDLERIEPDRAPAVDLLTAAEREALTGRPRGERARRFAALWAAKEAHAKWTGEPRRVDPAQVEVDEHRVRSAWGETLWWRRDAGGLVATACLDGRPTVDGAAPGG